MKITSLLVFKIYWMNYLSLYHLIFWYVAHRVNYVAIMSEATDLITYVMPIHFMRKNIIQKLELGRAKILPVPVNPLPPEIFFRRFFEIGSFRLLTHSRDAHRIFL